MHMTTAEYLQKLDELQTQMHAYNHAQGVLYYDSATAAPRGSAEARSRTLGLLSEVSYKLFVNDSVKELLSELNARRAELNPLQARQVAVLQNEYDKTTCIPMQEVIDYTMLLNEAESVWRTAKETNDYASFKPYLEKIVRTNVRFAGYRAPDKPVYDALLDEYEKGMTSADLEVFFGGLKQELVPLIHAVQDKPLDDSFLTGDFPVEKQRVLSDRLMALMGIDRAYCSLGETEHPFTTEFSKYDVRITTHYYPAQLASSMYSVIHEGGHALYALQMADELQFTCLADGASLGVHESQSRFYENIIGRSLPFVQVIHPLMTELFPQLRGVSAEQLYRAVNKATPSLIRTESDELTYPMHIIIRYELEKRLISGDLTVDDLPAAWNALYKQYLGVEVPDDTRGVLQDSHWSGGMIGYFPTYALGSAYAAQMLAAMEKELPLWDAVARGDLKPVTSWLGEHVHRFGMMKEPRQVVEDACGAPFDAGYYTRYLRDKYTKLYQL